MVYRIQSMLTLNPPFPFCFAVKLQDGRLPGLCTLCGYCTSKRSRHTAMCSLCRRQCRKPVPYSRAHWLVVLVTPLHHTCSVTRAIDVSQRAVIELIMAVKVVTLSGVRAWLEVTRRTH